MIKVIKSEDLKTNADLVCTHCGKEHHKLRSIEGKDFVFETEDGEEWCICVECKKYCDENNI